MVLGVTGGRQGQLRLVGVLLVDRQVLGRFHGQEDVCEFSADGHQGCDVVARVELQVAGPDSGEVFSTYGKIKCGTLEAMPTHLNQVGAWV